MEVEFGFPVLAVVRFQHLVQYLSIITAAPAVTAADSSSAVHSAATGVVPAAQLSRFTAEEIAAYKQRYGVQSD